MSTNEMYQSALADMSRNQARGWGGVARQALPNGDELFCMVRRVAGRSIVRSHHRTTWGLRPAAEQYQKPISQDKAAALLAELCTA